MIIAVDMDGTICSKTKNHEYSKAKPNEKMISAINKLFDDGHFIKIYTARGQVSGKHYDIITKEQLDKWNVKYNILCMNKEAADIYVDDLSMKPEDFLECIKQKSIG